MLKVNEDVWKVEKGDKINMEWMKKHPEVSILRGCTWDVENEKEVYSDNINPFGKYGYARKK